VTGGKSKNEMPVQWKIRSDWVEKNWVE